MIAATPKTITKLAAVCLAYQATVSKNGKSGAQKYLTTPTLSQKSNSTLGL